MGLGLVPGTTSTITWCRRCSDNDAVPAWVADTLYLANDGEVDDELWLSKKVPVYDADSFSYVNMREYFAMHSSRLDEVQLPALTGGCCGGSACGCNEPASLV